MKNGLLFSRLLPLVLVLAPTTFASTTLYVNGATGNDSNHCLSAQAACKTIGHAISLAASGDTIMVAAATYTEWLTIDTSLNMIGSDAATTIIDARGGGRRATISSASAHVILSNLTIRNANISGFCGTPGGAGISNIGTSTIMNSIVSGNTASAHTFVGAENAGCGITGGGILNSGTMTIDNSTVSANSVWVYGCFVIGTFCSATGGAISSSGTLTIKNSAISGNTAVARSTAPRNHISLIGGIFENGGTVTINGSTISGK